MSDDVVIRAEGLGKKYLIGHQAERQPYYALRDVMARGAGVAWRKMVDLVHGRPLVTGDRVEEFWALKDVNFEVKRGEVLGIIGRNGAGKSTLLKILSRITEPSAGRVTIDGRVASLLEVGTGFHPELTGRENIYLNGAILGMTRAEIRKKFDEIVAFAEVEKFLDTPVKRYSSGMYVRLAFAVAAHLEPEILIVDEVLAVGDADFQKKCLGKMDEVSRREGRTVLVVSHNMGVIRMLTERALMLDGGILLTQGKPAEVTAIYLSRCNHAVYARPAGQQYAGPHVGRIAVLTSSGGAVHSFSDPLEIRFEILYPTPIKHGCFSFQIVNQFQQPVIHAVACYPDFRFGDPEGRSILLCRFPKLKLNVGSYHLRTFLSGPPSGEVYEMLDGIANFEVVRTDTGSPWGWRPEVCAYHEYHEWQMVNTGERALA
jgi:homopolymeric O-antigen transport system ATP-binding protein